MSPHGFSRGGIARHPLGEDDLIAVTPTAKNQATPSNAFVAWLVLIGIAIPSSINVYLGDAKFTPARIFICLLLLPALAELFRRGRHLGASDALVCTMAIWMFVAASQTDHSWSSTAALIIEFCAGYIVARAYFFGRPALETFVRVLEAITLVIIALAALEHVTQHNIVTLFGLPDLGHEYRYGLLRASSTFPHPILYGTFCACAGAVFLYSEQSFLRRIWYGGLCFLGCVLAMSSAPLLAFMIVLSAYFYDRILGEYRWRWRLLVTVMCAFFAAVFMIANKPVSWIVAHLTLDPSTGYFRVATWDSALYYIGFSPYVGYGFGTHAPQDDFFGNASVDCVWLAMALRFGIPLVILVLLANIASFRSNHSSSARHSDDPYVSNLCTGFTVALVVLMFVGLTVHYWNNLWMFWGICLGIRASLEELCLKTRTSAVLDRQRKLGYPVSSVAAGQAPGLYRVK